MPHVAAMYRYPIKGLTAEPLDELRVQPDGRVEGDRVLAFRFPHGTSPQERDGLDHWPKGAGLCVRDFPTLNRLRLTYTDSRVRLETASGPLVEAGLDEAGRAHLAQAVTEFLLSTTDADRLERSGPLRLLGDGHSARFQDRAAGYVTAHCRPSLAGLAAAVGQDLSEARFRSNLALTGMEAWAEDDLVGRRVRVGEVNFGVHAPIVRCLAIHANAEGVRDAPVMTTLTRVLGRDQPSFGVLLLASGAGVIRAGDEVETIG